MKLLCVHPNYELYGSDRAFANFVSVFVTKFSNLDIEVLIPKKGDILTIYPLNAVKTTIRRMWILRRKEMIKDLTLNLLRNITALYRALHAMNKADVIYINTIISFDFILMSRFVRKKKVIIHVHEIPNGVEMFIFRNLLIWSKAELFLFNSKATCDAFSLPKSFKHEIVYNGCEVKNPFGPSGEIWRGDRRLNILLIGRLNRWKGQEILVGAIGKLSPSDAAKVNVRIVGGVFNGMDTFRERLENQIRALSLTDTIEIHSFQPDPTDSYKSADVVVIPSRLPEPFGIVAIEAMAFGKPIIASGHGGLVEIVDDGKTGLLFEPGNCSALAVAIKKLLDDPALLASFGQAGYARHNELFTLEKSNASFYRAVAPYIQ